MTSSLKPIPPELSLVSKYSLLAKISPLFHGVNATPSAMLLLSRFICVRLCETQWTAAHHTPPSLGFSRREYWSGLPFPSPMHESEKWKWSHSVVSDSSWLHGLQPTRLLCPWDSPGKSTGVGCHCLQQYLTAITITKKKSSSNLSFSNFPWILCTFYVTCLYYSTFSDKQTEK